MKIGLSGGELAVTEGVRPLAEACGRLGVRWVELWYPLNTAAIGLEATLTLLAGAGISAGSVGTATELGSDGNVSAARRTIEEAAGTGGERLQAGEHVFRLAGHSRRRAGNPKVLRRRRALLFRSRGFSLSGSPRSLHHCQERARPLRKEVRA
jgi:hypothetical protein